jgi:hypothetical protein
MHDAYHVCGPLLRQCGFSDAAFGFTAGNLSWKRLSSGVSLFEVFFDRPGIGLHASVQKRCLCLAHCVCVVPSGGPKETSEKPHCASFWFDM